MGGSDMQERTLLGYAYGDVEVLSDSGELEAGELFRITSDHAAPSDALTFAVTDNDTTLEGHDSTQHAVVTDATGTVVAMGVLHLDRAVTFRTPDGDPVTLYRVTVDGQAVGYFATGALVPGVGYRIESEELAGTSVDYDSLVAPSHDPMAAQAMAGGAEADSLEGGADNDTLSGNEGRDTLYGGDGNDSLYGGTSDDQVHGDDGDDAAWLGQGNDSFGSHDERGNDLVYGEAGGDNLNGGVGDDTLYGGVGSDSLVGGLGTDWLYGGTGRDHFSVTDTHEITHIDGGEQDAEADIVYFSNFASGQGVHIVFGSGQSGTYKFFGTDAQGNFSGIEVFSATGFDDFIDGRNANDIMSAFGNAGDDLIYGGARNDTLRGGAGRDTIDGGAGNDQMFGDDGADSFRLSGAAGADTITGGEGPDDGDTLDFSEASGPVRVVYSGAEAGQATVGGGTATFTQIERVELGSGDDLVDAALSGTSIEVTGGDGRDTLVGGSGADTLFGQAGDDSIVGGGGDDLVTGGAGSDTLTGGAGADRFMFLSGDGSARITDFDMTRSGARTADQLDLSGLRDVDGNALTFDDITVSADGDGNAVLSFPMGESITLVGVPAQDVRNRSAMASMGMPCFAAGTPIATPAGERVVEEIAVGDLVLTRDHGPQPVIWRGNHQLGPAALAARPEWRPVRIRAGLAGARCDLVVSPQHALVIANGQGAEALVRARHLAEFGQGRARLMLGCRQIDYHHLLLPRHALIRAAGALTESLWPGPMALRAFDGAAREDIRRVVTSLAPSPAGRVRPLVEIYGRRALPLLDRRDARAWLAQDTVTALTA
jgi:Ca2+-binding RTX toxin-like protein